MRYKRAGSRMEDVAYNLADFPVYFGQWDLASFPGYRVLSHWHDDLEFLYLLSGRLCYSINDRKVHLKAGEGIFINGRQLHSSCSEDGLDCTYLCLLFHPTLLCASPYVEQKFVLPVLENQALPFLALRPADERQRAVLDLLAQLGQCQGTPLFALEAESLIFRIWEQVYLLSGQAAAGDAAPRPSTQHLTALKEMIRFIYGHYTEKVTLEQICRAGHVGKTTCCNVFQKYTGESPVSYLTSYRLKKALELLESTDKTMAEICFAVGFSNASYFTGAFRRCYRCTPTAYRARLRKTGHASMAISACKSAPQQV